MKPTESKFWDSLRSAAPQGPHMQRLDVLNARGVPDVNICMFGVDYWCELKVAHGNHITFEKGQLAWMVERSRAGGRCFVVVYQPCPEPPVRTVRIIRITLPLPLDFVNGSMEHCASIWTTPRGFWSVIAGH